MTSHSRFLADTSALIEYFLGNQKFAFMEKFIERKTILVNSVVLTEFLPHAVKEEEFRVAAIVSSISRTIMEINWDEILKSQINMFRDGHRKVGIPDLLIAQNCIQNDISLITHDRHFEIIAKYLPLSLYQNT